MSAAAPTDRFAASLARVLRSLCALVIGGTLSAFSLLLLTADYETAGPVVVSVTKFHGLHAGDLFVIAGWAVAMGALVLLARYAGRVRTPLKTGAGQPEP